MRDLRPLSERVHAWLRESILDVTLLPGAPIIESDVAARFGASRTPVREALLRLQAEGYLEIKRHKGIRVLPLSAADMRDIYQVISALEGTAVELIAQRRPPAKEFAAIEDALARLEEYQSSKSVDKWGDADETFHRELMRLSGNARLYGFGCQLRDFAKRAHLVALRMQTDAYRARSTKNHGALLAALRGPHPDEAVAQHQAQRRRGEEALVGVVEKFHLTSL
jgi:DNA-binding GntR family transcriptional regulator